MTDKTNEQALPELPPIPTEVIVALADKPMLQYDAVRDAIKAYATRYALAALASDTGERGVGVADGWLIDRVGRAISNRWAELAGADPDEHWQFIGQDAKEDAESAIHEIAPVQAEAALRAQPAGGGDIPQWALPAVESALSIMDLQGYWHSDLAAFRDWLKEKSQ